MKYLFVALISFLSICATAQVKFTPENTKTKVNNIVYVGVANTFKVTTPQEISVTKITASQGNIRMNTDGSFGLYVHEVHAEPVELKYTQTKNGVETEVSYPTKYVIKNKPAPYHLKVGENSKSGTIALAKIQKNFKLAIVETESGNIIETPFECDILYQAKRAEGIEYHYKSSTPVENKSAIEKITKGLSDGTIYFENIRMTAADGGITELEPVTLLIN